MMIVGIVAFVAGLAAGVFCTCLVAINKKE